MSLRCAKCGSARIMPDVKILDQGQHSDGSLKAVVEKNPEAWIFKHEVVSRVLARICAECGFTELYVEDAEALYKAYRQFVDREKEKSPGIDREGFSA